MEEFFCFSHNIQVEEFFCFFVFKSIAAGQLHMIMVWVDLAGVWGPRGGHGSVCVWGGLYCVCPFICVCMYVFICVHKISDHVCWGCTLTSAKKHCYAISQAPAWAPRVS